MLGSTAAFIHQSCVLPLPARPPVGLEAWALWDRRASADFTGSGPKAVYASELAGRGAIVLMPSPTVESVLVWKGGEMSQRNVVQSCNLG